MSKLEELVIEEKKKDFDPIPWIERLLDVVDQSQFTDKDKKIIKRALNSLMLDLDIPF